jgi:hypothetical protein
MRSQSHAFVLREVVEGAIGELYARVPQETGELKDLAAEVLQDDEAVRHLMKQVKAAILKRSEQMDRAQLMPATRPSSAPSPAKRSEQMDRARLMPATRPSSAPSPLRMMTFDPLQSARNRSVGAEKAIKKQKLACPCRKGPCPVRAQTC